MRPPVTDAETRWVRAALAQLNVDRLALILFEAACPRPDAEDVGVGTLYGGAGHRLIEFARRLGFDAIQLGPQGAMSEDNASPYDSTAFSRNPLCVALDDLLAPEGEGGLGLLDAGAVASVLERRPRSADKRAAHRFACQAQRELLAQAHRRLTERAGVDSPSGPGSPGAWIAELDVFRQQHAPWLVPDALYDALCTLHGSGDFATWPATSRLPATVVERDAGLWRLARPLAPAMGLTLGCALEPDSEARLRELVQRHEPELARYAFVQFLLHRQHQALRRAAAERRVELYGDLAVGYSRRDLWHFRDVFLQGYWLGAPPSRTNPRGQPWGYPVLDPDLYEAAGGGSGPAARLLMARASKCFVDYDRLRIDHPHGLVCPWVYRAALSDAELAVQSGARLFSSPALPQHPELARYSHVRPEQLDPALPRYADGYIRELDADQIERFGVPFAILARAARGRQDRLICEVLSTQPYELGCVLRKHGLGRFRVTQKADLSNPDDVYRSENAKPEDWVLLGNHDTPSIWQRLAEWSKSGEVGRQADYLAARLARDPARREALAARWRSCPAELAHAKLADLFVSDSRNVMICFTDLFGFTEPYNVPGTISEHNWSQRLPRDYERLHAEAAHAGRALSLPAALRLALERCRPESELLHADVGRTRTDP